MLRLTPSRSASARSLTSASPAPSLPVWMAPAIWLKICAVFVSPVRLLRRTSNCDMVLLPLCSLKPLSEAGRVGLGRLLARLPAGGPLQRLDGARLVEVYD